MASTTAKTVTPCKNVNDVKTLVTTLPYLMIRMPTIPVGHPNEAALVRNANLAADAPTIAMQNDAVQHASLLGTTTAFNADY